MPVTPDADRARWRDLWRSTICELRQDGTWIDLARVPPAAPTLLITAWNPDGTPLAEAANLARDAALHEELSARLRGPRRARGRSPDGTWHEDGWAVPYGRAAAIDLLTRYGQLAAFVFDGGGRGLLWRDGAFEWLEPPP